MPCEHKEGLEEGQNGFVVPLIADFNDNIVLCFAVDKENADLINFVLEEENKSKISMHDGIVGVYKTMLSSWKAGERFLSGIILDAVYDADGKDLALDAHFVLVDSNGRLDSFAKTTFIHAVVTAAIEDMEIYVTDDLFEKLKPAEQNESEEDDDDDGGTLAPKPNSPKSKDFPIDHNLLKKAKEIMDGTVKDT